MMTLRSLPCFVATLFCFPSALAADWYVKPPELWLRDTPSIGGRQVKMVRQGGSLTGQQKNGLWVQVKTSDGVLGWALSTLLSKSPVLSSSSGSDADKKSESDVKKARSRPRIQAATMGVRGLRSSDQLARFEERDSTADKNAQKDLVKMESTQPTSERIQSVHSHLVGTREKN